MILLRRLVPILTIAYWITMFVATHLPADRVPRTGVGDKTGHVVGYAGLAALLCVSLGLRRPGDRKVPVVVLVGVLLYAAFDELTQPLIGRIADPIDWLADASGAVCAVVVFVLVRERISRLGSAQDQQASVGKLSGER